MLFLKINDFFFVSEQVKCYAISAVVILLRTEFCPNIEFFDH